jgi:hypothetical protein
VPARAVAVSATSVAVPYGLPSFTGASPLNRFTARCASTDGGTTRSGSIATDGHSTRSISVTGLSVGKSYRCRVRAVNAEGPGAFSPFVAVSRSNVIPWGMNSHGQHLAPTGLTDAVAVAAGYAHTLALRRNGTVVAWGDNSSGQATVPTRATDVVAITAGGAHSVALRRDGTVVAWGANEYGQRKVPAGLDKVVDIAAGDGHTMALRRNGTIVAWGYNYDGQRTVPAGLADARAIAANWYHSVALRGPLPPAPPRDVRVTPGNRAVAVAWRAPLQNGGAAITDYRARAVVVKGTGRTGKCATTGARTCTITGLTNGTVYKIEVAARTSVGWGHHTASVDVRPRA